MTKEQRLIRRFVRAAKMAMPHLEHICPGFPGSDAWLALYRAVESAKKLK